MFLLFFFKHILKEKKSNKNRRTIKKKRVDDCTVASKTVLRFFVSFFSTPDIPRTFYVLPEQLVLIVM